MDFKFAIWHRMETAKTFSTQQWKIRFGGHGHKLSASQNVFSENLPKETLREWLQSDRLLPGIEFNALRAGGNRDINTNGQGPFRLLLSFQVRFFSFQMLRQCKSGEVGSGQVSGVCFRICIVENE